LIDILPCIENIANGCRYYEGTVETANWQNKILRLLADQQDKEMAEKFWSAFRDIYDKYKRYFFQQLSAEKQREIISKVEGIKRGLIGEIGVYKALKAIGQNPVFSTEKDNVDAGVDILIRKTNAEILIQVKHTNEVEKLKVYGAGDLKAEEELRKEEGADKHYKHFYAKVREALEKLRGVCWNKRLNNSEKKFLGLVIVAPLGYFDNITGQPTKEAIQAIQKNLEPHFKEIGELSING